MSNTLAYDHFSTQTEGHKGTGLVANLKATDFFSGNLQITEKGPEAKGIASAGLGVVHNSINAFGAPLVDYTNKVTTRAMNILKPIATATVGSPIQTVKQNGFFKGGAKLAGSTAVGAAGLVSDTAGSILQTPAKVYERLVNANVQEGADVLHLFAEKLRGADKFGLKTILPGFADGLGNGLKVLSKMGGYISGPYALNWLGRNLNKAGDIAQEYVKLNNVTIEQERKVQSSDATVLES